MYSRILVPLDGSPASQRGLQEAIKLASKLGSALRLLNIVDLDTIIASSMGYGIPDGVREACIEGGEEILKEAAGLARAEGLAVETRVSETLGRAVSDAIVDDARDSKCALVVMGTHGRRGLRRLALGSDAESVLRLCPVPVLLVREDTGPSK